MLAVRAVLAGRKQKDVAKIFGIHFKILSSWAYSFRNDPESLHARPNTGSPPRSSPSKILVAERNFSP